MRGGKAIEVLATTSRLYRGVLDRATGHRTDPEWLAEAWGRSRVIVVDGDRAPVVGDPATDTAVKLALLDPADAPEGERLFLGVDADDRPLFAVAAEVPDVPGAQPRSLRTVGHLLSDADADLFTTAVALANWHADHRFHPRTGEPTRAIEGGWVRVPVTGGGQQWPRTDPAMIVLVHDGVPGPEGRCLLAHKPEWPENRYSCVAGYVEPGESAEASVVREVDEEVGVRAHDVRYVTSQPWPFPRSLMLAFTALADPSDEVRVDGEEIEDARWFSRADFDGPGRPLLPYQTSVAYFLITSWLQGGDRREFAAPAVPA